MRRSCTRRLTTTWRFTEQPTGQVGCHWPWLVVPVDFWSPCLLLTVVAAAPLDSVSISRGLERGYRRSSGPHRVGLKLCCGCCSDGSNCRGRHRCCDKAKCERGCLDPTMLCCVPAIFPRQHHHHVCLPAHPRCPAVLRDPFCCVLLPVLVPLTPPICAPHTPVQPLLGAARRARVGCCSTPSRVP